MLLLSCSNYNFQNRVILALQIVGKTEAQEMTYFLKWYFLMDQT